MAGFRERMAKFMYGRYGTDELSRIYLILAIACLAVHLLTRSIFFYLAGMVLLIYGIYRSFSKNTAKMSAQNQKYMTWRYKLVVKYNQTKKQWAQRRDYRFYRCPDCRQKVRVPRGRGKIAITCPKCKTEFIKKS